MIKEYFGLSLKRNAAFLVDADFSIVTGWSGKRLGPVVDHCLTDFLS
jgi:hypothetical protein